MPPSITHCYFFCDLYANEASTGGEDSQGTAYFDSVVGLLHGITLKSREINLESSQMLPAGAENNDKNHLHEVKLTNISIY
jgi:hypothetical protein